ncbi:MAG TPA: hypothetical protein VH186_38870 [Chloroflexia bacterium]|nr:hypothetical protein [Chloroflexia bacterium]
MTSVTVKDIATNPENETELRVRLAIRPAIDFKQQLSSLRDSGASDLLDEFGDKAESAWLERPVWLEDRPFLIRLTEAGTTDTGSYIELSLLGDDTRDEPADEKVVKAAITHASRRFCWDLDMEEARKALSVNEYGEDLVARYWPYRPANLPSPWEGLLKTVVSVQIYPGLATRLQQALLEFYSDRTARFRGRQYRFFPTVERLAEIMPDDLLGLRFSRQKARYLPGLAQMILEQPAKFDWERLRQVSGAEAVATLDELPGVGPWIAHYVAMRGLPHQDVFVDEGGLRKTLAVAFDRRAEVSSEEAAKLTAVYAPYRSLACYYSYMRMYNV